MGMGNGGAEGYATQRCRAAEGCRKRMRRVVFSAFVLLASACAPEPTTPADTNLGGVWASNARLFTLSEFRMNLVQEPRGVISGGWTAKGEGGGGGCAVGVPCNASGLVIGRNTIAQVEIELLGAGKFEGGLVEPDKMRGIFAIAADYDTITFVRTSPCPPGQTCAVSKDP